MSVTGVATAGARPEAGPEAVTISTPHYVLTAETTPSEAEEMGRVLEAAWPGFRDFFGAEPKRARDERLSVVFCASQASFAARLRDAGVEPPAAGGYYHLGSRTAYAWRQPTIYYTRCLLLHEAIHQFHYLARTDNRTTLQGWYVEGLAEHLCRHTWDGQTLVLGVIPTLSLKDYPAAALRALQAEDADLGRLLGGGALSREVSWAVVHYLLTADGGKHRRKFERLATKLDRGNADPDLLFETLGRPARLESSLRAWLPTVQEPWAQIFNEWEGTAPGRFRGTAGDGIVSACRIKAEARSISATVVAPPEGPWLAGLLLSGEDRDDYTVGLVSEAGAIRVHRRRDAAWERLLERTRDGLVPAGRVHLHAEREGDRVTLWIAGDEVGVFDLPGRTFGLALQGGTATFEDVRWE